MTVVWSFRQPRLVLTRSGWLTYTLIRADFGTLTGLPYIWLFNIF